MDCIRIRNLLPDYSVELLDARTRRTVEAHLSACDACRAELRALDAAAALVERYGARTPPPALFQGIRNRIESGEARQERPAWWGWLYSRPARGLAMGLAMASVAVGLLMPVSQPTIPSTGFHSAPRAGQLARGEIASSIRQHAMSASDGPIADRVAWEALAQLASQEKESRPRTR